MSASPTHLRPTNRGRTDQDRIDHGQVDQGQIEPIVSTPSGRPDLVMVGGVPGAGKTTAIRAALAVGTGPEPVRALDSDQIRRRLEAVIGGRLPYRWYRPVVHTLHLLRMIGWILVGPELAGSRLLVHDPCTRSFRLRALGRLAESRGWRTSLVLVDADRAQALDGQTARGRVVRVDSFLKHWERWTALRAGWRRWSLSRDAAAPDWAEPWDDVRMVDRSEAAGTLTGLLNGLSAGPVPTVPAEADPTRPLALAS